MQLVLDCSVAIAWLFEDEASAFTDLALDHVTRHGAVVPGVWTFEIASALLVAVRRGRTTYTSVEAHLALLRRPRLEIVPPPSFGELHDLCDLALLSNLSPYDAAYLQLAQARGLPLATLDKKLANAAIAQGIQLFQ